MRPFSLPADHSRLFLHMLPITAQAALDISRFRLYLAFLPLVLSLVWPRSHGPSLLITPFLMGLAAVAWIGVCLRPRGSLPAAGWLLLVLGVMWLSPWTQTLLMWATVAAALAAWLSLSIGQAAALRTDLMQAAAMALIFGALVNVFVAWLQFFHLELSLYPLVSMNGSMRPYGNLRQPNHLATLCVVGFVTVWWGTQQRLWRLRTAILLTQAMLSGLVLSVSRAGWVELILVSGFLAWWADGEKRFNRWLFGLAPFWALLWSLSLQAISLGVGAPREALTERGAASVTARFVHWQSAWDMALRHPTQGAGWGEFRYNRFMEEPIVTGAEIADNAHNLVLHLLAELGFAGTFLILAPVVWLLIVRRPWRQHSPLTVRWGWGVIVAISVHSLLEFPLWYMNFLVPMGFAFGTLLAPQGGQSHSGWREVGVRASAFLAVVVLAFTGLAAYDFARVIPAFLQDDRSSGEPVASAKAQETWLYGSYADRIVAAHVPVTKDNALAIWALSLRLMHVGPEPLSLWSGLAAQCQMGGSIYARELARRFELAFPKQFAEFESQTPASIRQTCFK